MNILGIDIGGSSVKGAPVNIKKGELLADRWRVETPDKVTPGEMGEIIASMVERFKWRGPIGVGFPGVVHNHVIHTSANLHPDFIGCNLAKLVHKATGRPTAVVNDADAAGIAEMTFGAGKGVGGTVALFTLGTGVGSALFTEGVLYPNAELGHIPLRGRSAEKWVAASVKTKQKLSWSEWSGRLNQYLAIVETILEPDLIILGGGISADSRHFFPLLKTRAKCIPARFKNEAGIVGAALFARDAAHRR